jgi:hypothetical protein
MVPNSVMQGGHNILKAGMQPHLHATYWSMAYSYSSVALLVHTFSTSSRLHAHSCATTVLVVLLPLPKL